MEQRQPLSLIKHPAPCSGRWAGPSALFPGDRAGERLGGRWEEKQGLRKAGHGHERGSQEESPLSPQLSPSERLSEDRHSDEKCRETELSHCPVVSLSLGPPTFLLSVICTFSNVRQPPGKVRVGCCKDDKGEKPDYGERAETLVAPSLLSTFPWKITHTCLCAFRK